MYDQKRIISREKDNSYYSSRSRQRRSFENSKSFEKNKRNKNTSHNIKINYNKDNSSSIDMKNINIIRSPKNSSFHTFAYRPSESKRMNDMDRDLNNNLIKGLEYDKTKRSYQKDFEDNPTNNKYFMSTSYKHQENYD